MGGAGVIDNFLGVFTSYIDSGFGLLGGEVAFIATTLIVIDATRAALFWSWGADEDIIARYQGRRMFMGTPAIGAHGVMESDPLLIQAEQKLIGQADELIVLADSSKFAQRSSLLLCPLARIHTVITDDRIDDRAAQLLEAAEVRLIVAEVPASDRTLRAQQD